MKRFRLLNSDDGMIVDEVDTRSCKYCTSAFICKDDSVYHLIDADTGLAICHSKKLSELELLFISRRKKYEDFKKTDAYKIKVERFTKLIAVYNYGKDHK